MPQTHPLSQESEQVADLLKLLAHPLRVKVLCRLAQGECSVGDLTDECKAAQPAISQILARMKSEGLVAARREGKFIFYSVADARVSLLMKSLKKIFCDLPVANPEKKGN